MGIFSSKRKSELDKLIEENDELKNTLHSFVQKHQSLSELDNKIAESRKDLLELSKMNENLRKELKNLDQEIKTKKENLENQLLEEGKESQVSEELLQQIEEKRLLLSKLSEQYNALQNNLGVLKKEEERIHEVLNKYGGNFEDAAFKIKEEENEFIEKLNQLKAEESKKNVIIKSLDEKISLSEEIKANLETSISALVGQLAEKEKAFTEFSLKRDSILEEIRSRQKEFDEFEYKFKYHKETINKAEDELKQLSEKRSLLLEEVRKFEIVRSETQDKILQQRSEEERLNELITMKQKAIEELEKRKFDIEESHLHIENNLAQVLLKFTEEISSSKNRLGVLKQEIFDKEKDVSTKEKILLEKTSQIAEYGGMTKILQKERSTTEQSIANLKEHQNELNEELSALKDKVNKQKINLSQLKAETETLQSKKEIIEKEFRLIFTQGSENYKNLEENKQRIYQEIAVAQKELDELKNNITVVKAELRDLKLETTGVETQKEEFAAKISELIALEKNLKYRISEYEKKLANS